MTGSALYVSTALAAQIHGVNPRTIRKWIDAGKITGTKINDTWMIAVTSAQLEQAGIDPSQAADPESTAPVPHAPSLPAVPQLDLEPIAATIREITARNEQLATERTAWQARAEAAEAREAELRAELEQRPKALPAGDGSTTPTTPPKPWWRRLISGG